MPKDADANGAYCIALKGLYEINKIKQNWSDDKKFKENELYINVTEWLDYIQNRRFEQMEDLILISNLNDFIFCPVSIYFHKLYGNQDNLTYQSQYQINGTKAHEKVDNKKYSTRKSVKMALDVYSDEYKIVGKIDLYDEISKTLIERKKFVKKIYDGYIFQLYAQYYAMTEMGYEINHLEVRSLDDNKNIKLHFQMMMWQ